MNYKIIIYCCLFAISCSNQKKEADHHILTSETSLKKTPTENDYLSSQNESIAKTCWQKDSAGNENHAPLYQVIHNKRSNPLSINCNLTCTDIFKSAEVCREPCEKLCDKMKSQIAQADGN